MKIYNVPFYTRMLGQGTDKNGELAVVSPSVALAIDVAKTCVAIIAQASYDRISIGKVTVIDEGPVDLSDPMPIVSTLWMSDED